MCNVVFSVCLINELFNALVFCRYAEFLDYMGSDAAAGERDMANNHGTWFDVMWQGVSLTLGNTSVASIAASEVATRRVDKQVPLSWNCL